MSGDGRAQKRLIKRHGEETAQPGFLAAVSKRGQWGTVLGAYSVVQKHHSVRHGEGPVAVGRRGA